MPSTLPTPHRVIWPEQSRTETRREALPRQRHTVTLPMRITRDASKQAYYTVRLLVDRDRTPDAYRAYAYFRWVDDCLDQHLSERCERLAFVERQQALVDCGYWGLWPDNLTDEERMLEALIAGDSEASSGLQSYIRHMMAVMAFDADRRGQLISECELADYVCHLATAVTDALHYFIGHRQAPLHSEARYLPAMAAHITHMLRDTHEDLAAGYFNVPREVLEAAGIGPHDVASAPYREWVRSRVALARGYFAAGADYLDQVQSLRCRLAGYAYMARFAGILDAIEREEYCLRPAYPECKRPGYGLRMSGSVGVSALLRRSRRGSR